MKHVSHPKHSTDLDKPCVVYYGPDKTIEGVVVGVAYGDNPTCDVRTEQGVLKSIPTKNVRLT